MGRPTGCSAHQEIKVSSSNKWAVAHCDLFNSNRVNITDACKAGITVEELDDLCCGSGSLSFLLWFTHIIRAHFLVMGNHPQDMGSGSQKRRFQSQLLALLGEFSETEYDYR